MGKIILQDIDNVLYPFKEKHIEFLIDEKLITKDVAERALASKKPYIIDYFLFEERQGNSIKKATEILQKRYGARAKKTKKIIQERKVSIYQNENSLEIESLVFSTFEDFRESELFQTGQIQEMIKTNKLLKQKHPELKIIGITARGIHAKKEPELFEQITNRTHTWNIKNDVGLDEIFFEKNKINAYNEIINKDEYKDHEVICFIEDDPKNIEPFLKIGITCILIEFEHHEQEELVERLKDTYPNLIIAKNHEDASQIMMKLTT